MSFSRTQYLSIQLENIINEIRKRILNKYEFVESIKINISDDYLYCNKVVSFKIKLKHKEDCVFYKNSVNNDMLEYKLFDDVDYVVEDFEYVLCECLDKEIKPYEIYSYEKELQKILPQKEVIKKKLKI